MGSCNGSVLPLRLMSCILLGSLSLLHFFLFSVPQFLCGAAKFLFPLKALSGPHIKTPVLKIKGTKMILWEVLLLSLCPLLCRVGIHMWWCWHSNWQQNCLKKSLNTVPVISQLYIHRDICPVSVWWGQQGGAAPGLLFWLRSLSTFPDRCPDSTSALLSCTWGGFVVLCTPQQLVAAGRMRLSGGCSGKCNRNHTNTACLAWPQQRLHLGLSELCAF